MAVHVHMGYFGFLEALVDDLQESHTCKRKVINICDCDITVTVNWYEGWFLSTLEKNVEMSVDFGLTQNQAKVYLATARLPRARD